MKNDDLFYIFNEQGELVIARLSRNGYEEIGRDKILDATSDLRSRTVVWSHPAFAESSIFARNDKEIVRVDLSAR